MSIGMGFNPFNNKKIQLALAKTHLTQLISEKNSLHRN